MNDTEILDWMEKHRYKIYAFGDGWWSHKIQKIFPTLREAILAENAVDSLVEKSYRKVAEMLYDAKKQIQQLTRERNDLLEMIPDLNTEIKLLIEQKNQLTIDLSLVRAACDKEISDAHNELNDVREDLATAQKRIAEFEEVLKLITKSTDIVWAASYAKQALDGKGEK